MTGFLFSEEVAADGSPNAGIKDMIKVLEWIQEHISKCKHDSLPLLCFEKASLQAFSAGD